MAGYLAVVVRFTGKGGRAIDQPLSGSRSGIVEGTLAFDVPPKFRVRRPRGHRRLSYGAFMAVFLRKLLHIGGLPQELRTEVEAEGIIYLAEYVPVTRRFSGKIPGKRAHGDVASYVGSLALTNQRILGTLSSVPKLAGRTVDQRWDAAQSGTVTADLSEGGLHLEVSISAVDPRCAGQLSLQYKTEIPTEALTRVPRRSLAFDVPPEYVFRAVGVPYHP